MTGFTVVFLILMLAGITIVIFAVTLNKNIKEENNSLELNFNKMDLFMEKKDDLVNTIEDADDAIVQLNAISKNIFEKQEQKYNELLYLYKRIDEKKYALLDQSENSKHLVTDNKGVDSRNLNQIEKLEKVVLKKNDKNEQILNLSQTGMTTIQIAKQLNIGQGEVNLVLELKRKGDCIGK